jgi:hypothetical protein
MCEFDPDRRRLQIRFVDEGTVWSKFYNCTIQTCLHLVLCGFIDSLLMNCIDIFVWVLMLYLYMIQTITKLIQKSENLHRFHQFVLFYFTQYETKTENLKSELLYYNLAIILYNILLIESYRYAPPVQIEPVRSYYSLYHV